jgi:hypothetical protein
VGVAQTTKGPSWGYPRGRFWDLGTVLEPFCGEQSPKVDKPVKNGLLKYPHEGPWVEVHLRENVRLSFSITLEPSVEWYNSLCTLNTSPPRKGSYVRLVEGEPGLRSRSRVQSAPAVTGSSVQGAGFKVQGPGFRVQGSGSRVRGSGLRFEG